MKKKESEFHTFFLCLYTKRSNRSSLSSSSRRKIPFMLVFIQFSPSYTIVYTSYYTMPLVFFLFFLPSILCIQSGSHLILLLLLSLLPSSTFLLLPSSSNQPSPSSSERKKLARSDLNFFSSVLLPRFSDSSNFFFSLSSFTRVSFSLYSFRDMALG